MSKLLEVKVPDIGDFKNIPVIEVMVKPGDTVKAEDPLVTLESDKATVEVPSPAGGVVAELKVAIGDKVSEGSLLLMLDEKEAESAATREPAPAPSVAPASAKQGPVSPAVEAKPQQAAAVTPVIPIEKAPAVAAASASSAAHASPSVRLFARELGVDLSLVPGSGPKGRTLRADVQNFVKSRLTTGAGRAGGAGALGFNLPEAREVDYEKFGAVERQPLSRIRKLSGSHLHRNWISIPHVTQHDLADITELERFRKSQSDDAKKDGIRLTLLAFLMKAAVTALKQYPNFNASLSSDGEQLVVKRYFHIGVAVDTPNGLVVPVIRDADRKGLLELARELGETSARMRDGKINPTDLQGGCFSISSLGGVGGSFFTPIINAPEVAILGVSKAATMPHWNGSEFVPRLMLPLSLSYDHRVIDGAQGARFIAFLGTVLSDIRLAL